MKTSRCLLMMVFALAFASVCVRAGNTISTQSFGKDVVVTGVMGVPLGKVVKIEAVVVSGYSGKGHSGEYFLKILKVGSTDLLNMPLLEFITHSWDDVKMAPDVDSLYRMKNGKSAERLTKDEIRSLETGYVGRGFTLLAYEQGSFSGIPENLAEAYTDSNDAIYGWQDRSFGYRPYLVVLRVLDEWAVSAERAKMMEELEKQNAHEARVSQMMISADVVIDYESRARIFLRLKNCVSVETTPNKIVEAIAGATDKREMAVVCIGPPMRRLSEDKLREEVDSFERLLKEMGFKRVVFTLASAFGNPIYRE